MNCSVMIGPRWTEWFWHKPICAQSHAVCAHRPMNVGRAAYVSGHNKYEHQIHLLFFMHGWIYATRKLAIQDVTHWLIYNTAEINCDADCVEISSHLIDIYRPIFHAKLSNKITKLTLIKCWYFLHFLMFYMISSWNWHDIGIPCVMF